MIKPLFLNKPIQISLTIIFSLFLLGCDPATPEDDQEQSVISAIQDGLNVPVLTTTPTASNEGGSVIVATAESGPQAEQKTLEEIQIAVPVPTATQVPVSDPPFQTLDRNNLPRIQQDLVFVRSGILERWSAENQTISPIFEPNADPDRFAPNTFSEVIRADFSADGNRAAVVVRYVEPSEQSGDRSGDTESLTFAEGSTEYDILFLDLVSRESWTLVKAAKDPIAELTLSPNKSSVVFTTHPSQAAPNQNAGKIFMISTPASQSDRPLTMLQECNMGCRAITWRQDSELVVFEDLSGVYIMNIDGARPTLLYKNPGDADESPFLVVRHKPIGWALNGRSLLVEQRDMTKESAAYGVLDVADRQLIMAENDQALDTATWLEDSRLISAIQLENDDWEFQTFVVDYENQALQLDERFPLSFAGAVSNLSQSADNRFLFGLQNSDRLSEAGLYRLVSFSEQPERLSGIPNIDQTIDIVWNSDGSEAIQAIGNQTFLATADGNLHVFRDKVWGFEWVEG